MTGNIPWLALAWILSPAAAGCADSPDTFRDLPTEIDGEAVPPALQGAPVLQVGPTGGGSFRSFAEGQSLPVVHGVQGGRWIHLALRATGLPASAGQLAITVHMGDRQAGDDEPIAELIAGIRLQPLKDGAVGAAVIQVPVSRGDAEVAALAGAPCVLQARYAVAGRVAEERRGLVLTDE